MRPRGEVRQLFLQKLPELVNERGPMTCHEVAAATQVQYDVARATIQNMVRAGELVQAGHEKRPDWDRWQKLYEPAPPQPWCGIEALADVVQGWSGSE